MRRIGLLSENGATALMGRLGMGTTKRWLPRWALPADGTDLSLAYNRAVTAGQLTLEIPEGNYTWSTPQDYVQGLVLVGAKPMKSSPVGGTRISAPNGFLKNPTTSRRQIVVRNLYVLGTRVASSVGIDGPFGGEVEGCKIEGYDTLIQNMSGFLAFYRANAFANGGFGIKTADANGSVVEQCWFNDNVAVQVTTRDGTPQSGVNSGLPFIIRENNFNLTDLTTVALRVRGQLRITDNYFEKFSGSVANTMVDIEANRFDHQGLIFEGNELNGQSSNCTGLYLNGSHLNLENWMEGRVTCNRFIGLSDGGGNPRHVVYGPNNRIPGLKIYGNSRTTGDFAIVVTNSYRAQHLPDDGWTYLRLEADFTTGSATSVDVTGLAFAPEASAHYLVEGHLMLASAVGGATTTGVAPQPGITWPTNVGNGTYWTNQASASGSTLPRYGNTTANFTSGADSIPDTNPWPHKLDVNFLTLSNVSGDFKLTLRSEVAATNVTMKAGSYIRYRRLA